MIGSVIGVVSRPRVGGVMVEVRFCLSVPVVAGVIIFIGLIVCFAFLEVVSRYFECSTLVADLYAVQCIFIVTVAVGICVWVEIKVLTVFV